MPVKKKKKIKSKPKGWYVKKLDSVFSQYMRLSYSNDSGYVACYTCYAVKPWKEMQNGHYISRANMNTRWEEKNCRVQCMQCNVFKNGNYPAYTFRLLKEIGKKGMDELEAMGKEIRQFTPKELREMIAEYTEKIKGYGYR